MSLTPEERVDLGGDKRRTELVGAEEIVGMDRRRSELVGFDRRRSELVGAEEIVGDEESEEMVGMDRRRSDIIGQEIEISKLLAGAARAARSASMGRAPASSPAATDLPRTAPGRGVASIGQRPFGSSAAATDLPRTRPGQGYAHVGQRPHGGSPAATELVRTRPGEGYALVSGQHRLPRKARKLRRAILAKARAGREISAAEVDAFVRAAVAPHHPEHGKLAQKVKSRLLARIADLGGKVRGEMVSGMGDFISSATNFLGKAVGKTVQFGVRTAGGIIAAPFKAGKKTFFAPSKKKPAARAAVPTAAPGTELQSYAQRIATHRARIGRRRVEAQEALELAQQKKKLAELEAKEEQAVAELEAQAAEAEAEAEEMSGMGAIAPAALLKDKAAQARVAKAVLKTAGPFAKLALLNTGPGRIFAFARQIFKEAKADAAGPQKVAAVKAKAEAGDPKAKAVMDLLAVGKRTDAEMKAAAVVGLELGRQVLRARGVPEAVVGLLPASVKVVSAIPGAKDVYALAKAGNPAAVESIRKAGDLLRKLEAADPAAEAQVADLRKRALAGDANARVALAVLAVAAAGLEEDKTLKKVKAEHFRSTAAGEAAKVTIVKTPKEKQLEALQAQAATKSALIFAPLQTGLERLFGTRRVEEGLKVKLARR